MGCYRGKCWTEYARQLQPLARQARRIGVLLTYRELQRDLSQFPRPAGWVKASLGAFQELPPDRQVQVLPANRLLAVVQGWDVTDEQLAAQIERALESGVGGYLVARAKIDQSWRPQLLDLKE